MHSTGCDLYLGDIDEVRRRVVDPVLGAMLRPGELVSAELVVDDDWPGSDEMGFAFARWPNDPHADPPGSQPSALYLVIRAVGDEQHTVRLGEVGFYLDDAADITDSLEDSLTDWICETRFGWAEMRGTEGLVLPGPLPREDGRAVVEIWATGGSGPLMVDRVPTDPGDLGLSESLAADLREWQDLYLAAADEADAEEQRRHAARMAQPGPAGLSLRFIPDAVARAQAEAVARAREDEGSGAWRQLVARLEPMRDVLLERLRGELGDGYVVPTPPRVP